MSQADRRYPFKLANFRQRLSLVVARAVARQALLYMQSGACVAYEVSNDDLFIHEPFSEDVPVDSLDEYKYNGGAYSWLDERLNPFWYRCADLFPDTMAPNTITMIGTVFLMSIAVGVAVLDPKLEAQAPPWAYLWFAVCIFVYQTMDAVDGKQARRTKSSSPLGQLFDHGCDALGTMPLSLTICSAMGFGASVWSVVMAATIQLPFYLAQYEEHFAHSMRTQVANFGVTEGQYLEIVLMIVTAVMGKTFWDMQIPFTESFGYGVIPGPAGQENIPRLTLKTCTLYAGTFFPILLGSASFFTVLVKKGHHFSFLRLVPIFALQALLLLVAMTPREDSVLSRLFKDYTVFFLMTFGALFTHLANRVIIATVCKIPYPFIEWVVLLPLPLVLVVDEYLKDSSQIQVAIVTAYAVLIHWQYIHFSVNVGFQIARHLKINIFSLGKRAE